MKMKLDTEISRLFKIRYPVFLAGMAGGPGTAHFGGGRIQCRGAWHARGRLHGAGGDTRRDPGAARVNARALRRKPVRAAGCGRQRENRGSATGAERPAAAAWDSGGFGRRRAYAGLLRTAGRRFAGRACAGNQHGIWRPSRAPARAGESRGHSNRRHGDDGERSAAGRTDGKRRDRGAGQRGRRAPRDVRYRTVPWGADIGTMALVPQIVDRRASRCRAGGIMDGRGSSRRLRSARRACNWDSVPDSLESGAHPAYQGGCSRARRRARCSPKRFRAARPGGWRTRSSRAGRRADSNRFRSRRKIPRPGISETPRRSRAIPTICRCGPGKACECLPAAKARRYHGGYHPSGRRAASVALDDSSQHDERLHACIVNGKSPLFREGFCR